MKKRIIASVLCAITVITLFSACGKKAECEFCGEEKTCSTKTVFGEKVTICSDCMKELNEF